MIDLSIAYETIDMYAEKYLIKPDKSMTKSQLGRACWKMCAVDILKDYLKQHWFEAPPADLVYNFVKEHHRRSKLLKNDMMEKFIYEVSKEIFYYFI